VNGCTLTEKQRIKAISERMILANNGSFKEDPDFNAFLVEILKWASKKNKEQVIISVPKLLTAQEQEDNFSKWLTRHSKQEKKRTKTEDVFKVGVTRKLYFSGENA
jgi:hypothetical protein